MLKYAHKMIAILLLCTILLSTMPINVFAQETNSPKIIDDEYIYLDLYYGNVSISGTTYTGYVLENGVSTKKTGTIDRKIYIYQSKGDDTIWEDGLPKYDRVGAPTDSGKTTWVEYITNNTNVENVIKDWKTEAANVGRVATPNRITITGNQTYDITIDNIWSSYHNNSTGALVGGLAYQPTGNGSDTKALIYLKGDSRFGNIRYTCNKTLSHQIVFNTMDNGSVTVANIAENASTNHWNSAIGADDNDSTTNANGIVINNGIIYAGTTLADNCTAIGAGGNGFGGITINGGTVTAVCSSTGTAIGGGIGYGSKGGDADVFINGGTVYAYNFGCDNVPVAAIGGGSSVNSDGNTSTEITIEGGFVYAESVGGTAIGGGSSKTRNGGAAIVNIGGTAELIAKSVSSTTMNAGTAIGGGTAGTTNGMNGGNAILNIYGEAVIKTGSIGGGKINNSTGKIGNAEITISGEAKVQGQFVMASGSDKPCSFNMNGGIIDNSTKTDEFVFLQENGGAVHIENGTATITNGTIKNCSTATYGGAVYVNGGDFLMTGGTLENNTALDEGGAIYVINGKIEIGLEECLGNDNTHTHPSIINNTSVNKGGAISINGGTTTMYCGKITDNTSVNYQASNNIFQSNGTFEIISGTLGTGITTWGGSFTDSRDENLEVKFHAIYGDVNAVTTINLRTADDFVLPRENELPSELGFTREGLYLVGWSTSPDTDEGYILAGNKVPITENTDFYAVWSTEKLVSSYIVYIPTEITLDSKQKATFNIEAELKYFNNTSQLNVLMEKKNSLILENSNNNVALEYNILNSDGEVLNNGDVATTFVEEKTSDKLTIESKAKAIYAGQYKDTITFTVEYIENYQKGGANSL